MPRTKNSLRSVALVALTAFGCATFRMPASAPMGDVPFVQVRDVFAEPQIEMLLESGEEITPSETTAARIAAREALDKALEGRRIAPGPLGAEDPLIVVREASVARTDSRKSNQTAAKVGIVVGIVVVVAVIVAIIVSSKGDSAKGVPAVAAAKPPAPTPHVVVPRGGGPVVTVPKAVPRIHHVPVAPRIFVEPYIDFGYYYGDPWVYGVEGPPPAMPQGEPEEEEPPEAPPPPPPLMLPPAPSIDLEKRGFFAGDETVLDVVLTDRATGRVLWQNTVQHDVDPRDSGEMRKLLDEAFEGASWAAFGRAREPASR